MHADDVVRRKWWVLGRYHNASDRGIQPFREGIDSKDAKVPMGVFPCCEQRLHPLEHVRCGW